MVPKILNWLCKAAIALFLLQPEPVGAQHTTAGEAHRPKIHFSPQKGWMNDPNGMVYLNGRYHLFFQHNPNATVWGPMHWGHAVSTDLIHWEELPIALYPDSLGTIFSGSAVIDKNNTAGFGAGAMVAIYTSHSHELERTGSDKFQTQSIAYSLDEGNTWTKYEGNPVLKNPGIRDFRDPKVFWYEAGNKWIMTLATLDHITFYSSSDLKHWKEESKFGKDRGAHGGVWECPDLIPMSYNGKEVWVLIVNINPGGPNTGSATQYFTGSFNGHVFTPDHTTIKWLDYGPDEYAGITWSNTGNRKIFLGWMSNWKYANVVPTGNWRSAMTIARDLKIEKTGNTYRVASTPVKELSSAVSKTFNAINIKENLYDLTAKAGKWNGPAKLNLTLTKAEFCTITLSNARGEQTVIGYDKDRNEYFIDRTRSGKVDFWKGFAARHTAPRFTDKAEMDITLIIDDASVELFADNGLTVMTSIFFPNEPYNNITISSGQKPAINKLSYQQLSVR